MSLLLPSPLLSSPFPSIYDQTKPDQQKLILCDTQQSKYKYNAWKEISHISAAKAQASYIKEVAALIEKIGTRSA